MSQVYGSEAPRPHHNTVHQQQVRYVVVIDAGGSTIARLLLDDHTQVAEFDAGAEEVASLIRCCTPAQGARGAEWDRALQGHSAAERAAATVYRLAI